jgi:hypothetical protein
MRRKMGTMQSNVRPELFHKDPGVPPLQRARRLIEASKKEALELSADVQARVKFIEKTWWGLARLVDTCLKRHVPAALGMTAKQWMDKYLEGSLSDAFRKLRIFRGLAGVPDEKIYEMPERNAYELCRLPEAQRKSPEWVDQAAKLPVAQFKDRVDEALEKKGIARDKFGDFYLRAPVDVIEELQAAEAKIAKILSLDIETRPGLRIQVWSAIAALVNTTEEKALLVEMQGDENHEEVQGRQEC